MCHIISSTGSHRLHLQLHVVLSEDIRTLSVISEISVGKLRPTPASASD